MQADIDLPPCTADAIEQDAELAVLPHVQRQDYVGLELLRDRTDERFGFLILKGDGKIGTLRAKRFGATKGDGILVSDANHKRFLAGEGKHEAPFVQSRC